MDRRTLLRLSASFSLAGPSLAALATRDAGAQSAEWPARTITMVVPLPPGGQADLAARPVAAALEKILGKPVIVDNRAGAGGATGTLSVARAEADGYTLLMALSAIVVAPEAERVAGRTPPYEMSQLKPIGRVLGDPNLLAVLASSPYKNVQDIVDDAKKRPGEIAFSSSGLYGGTHVSIEMFAQAASIKLLHVPYRGGGPALTGLIGEQVAMTALGAGPLKGYTEQGKLRVLATFGETRHPAFPDAPTFAEAGLKDVVFYTWAGLFAPKALPDPIVARLRDALRQAMNDPQTVSIFEKAGSPPAYLDTPQFEAYIAEDAPRLVRAVQKIGKVE